MNLKRFQRKTAYNAEKANKADNFEFLNNKYCQKGQTVLAGDSITELFNNTELFQEYTAKTGLKVYNRGISGDTSDRFIERFERNVLNLEPENLVLLIGINDLNAGADISYVEKNIERIIDFTQNADNNTNIILEAVYPINKKINRYIKTDNKTILLLNIHLERLSKRKNIHFADLTEILADENGNFDAKYTYDGLHPNAYAYEAVSNKIISLLTQKTDCCLA